MMVTDERLGESGRVDFERAKVPAVHTEYNTDCFSHSKDLLPSQWLLAGRSAVSHTQAVSIQISPIVCK
jgi:hypothetical protein